MFVKRNEKTVRFVFFMCKYSIFNGLYFMNGKRNVRSTFSQIKIITLNPSSSVARRVTSQGMGKEKINTTIPA